MGIKKNTSVLLLHCICSGQRTYGDSSKTAAISEVRCHLMDNEISSIIHLRGFKWYSNTPTWNPQPHPNPTNKILDNICDKSFVSISVALVIIRVVCCVIKLIFSLLCDRYNTVLYKVGRCVVRQIPTGFGYKFRLRSCRQRKKLMYGRMSHESA